MTPVKEKDTTSRGDAGDRGVPLDYHSTILKTIKSIYPSAKLFAFSQGMSKEEQSTLKQAEITLIHY